MLCYVRWQRVQAVTHQRAAGYRPNRYIPSVSKRQDGSARLVANCHSWFTNRLVDGDGERGGRRQGRRAGVRGDDQQSEQTGSGQPRGDAQRAATRVDAKQVRDFVVRAATIERVRQLRVHAVVGIARRQSRNHVSGRREARQTHDDAVVAVSVSGGSGPVDELRRVVVAIENVDDDGRRTARRRRRRLGGVRDDDEPMPGAPLAVQRVPQRHGAGPSVHRERGLRRGVARVERVDERVEWRPVAVLRLDEPDLRTLGGVVLRHFEAELVVDETRPFVVHILDADDHQRRPGIKQRNQFTSVRKFDVRTFYKPKAVTRAPDLLDKSR